MHATIDELSLQLFVAEVLDYEGEYGAAPSNKIVNELVSYLQKAQMRDSAHALESLYSFNRAFRSYQAGKYLEVQKNILKTWAVNPKYFVNKGAFALLFRSLIRHAFAVTSNHNAVIEN